MIHTILAIGLYKYKVLGFSPSEDRSVLASYHSDHSLGGALTGSLGPELSSCGY